MREDSCGLIAVATCIYIACCLLLVAHSPARLNHFVWAASVARGKPVHSEYWGRQSRAQIVTAPSSTLCTGAIFITAWFSSNNWSQRLCACGFFLCSSFAGNTACCLRHQCGKCWGHIMRRANFHQSRFTMYYEQGTSSATARTTHL
ncbi:unnamed protein product [Amoebophrya sp. A120]|nr:unnamed protein product [Amoebophrya sp. A120]|eukprot:GSA120T00022841001.1